MATDMPANVLPTYFWMPHVPDRPIHVVFDAHAITPRRSGIGEYCARLLEAMCDSADADVQLSLYANGGITALHDAGELATITENISEGSLYSMHHQWTLPRLLRHTDCDLVHIPDFLVPVYMPVPFVCTVYDLIPLARPDYIRKSLKVRLLPLYRAVVRHAVRRAARVLTISRHSRDDIVRLLGVDASRIDITPLAPTVGSAVQADAELPGVLVPGRYLLYVGRHDPYKGLGLLLSAFACAAESGLPDDVTLAIAGSLDPRYGYGESIAALGLEKRVHFLDYVDAQLLPSLYAHALAFVFPSLYEGFGLPPLDAMRHSVPVVCSNHTSLPEVVGDAALRVDPEDERAFASALREICVNASLRNELIRSGLQRQQQFSWNVTAALTIETYKRAVQTRKHA
jgi:glycosyltransferase involved in cell wall biosynthesis